MNIRMFFGRLALCALTLTALLGDAAAYTNDQIFQNGCVIAIESKGASSRRFIRFVGGVDGAWGDLGGTALTDSACKLQIENIVKNSDGSYSCRLRSTTGYLVQGMVSIIRIRSTTVNTNQDTQVDFIPSGTDAATGNQLFYIRTYFDKTNTDLWYGTLSNKSIVDGIAGGSTYAFWDVEAAAFLNDRGGGVLRNHDNGTRSPGKWSNAAIVPDSSGNIVNHGATLWSVEVISLPDTLDKAAAEAAAKAAADKAAAEAAAKAAVDRAAAEAAAKTAADKAAAEAAAKTAADKAAAEAAAKTAADRAPAENKKTQALKGSGRVKVYTPADSSKGVVKELSQVKQAMPSAPVKQQRAPARRR